MGRNKPNKLPLILAGIVLATLLVLLLSGKVTLPTGAAALDGFTVFSVSQVSVNGQNQLIMTTAMDAAAQKAYVNLQNSSISSALQAAGWNASDVTITAEILNQSCRYRIDYFNEIVYSTTGVATCQDGGSGQCRLNCGTTGFGGQTNGGSSWCYAFQQTPSKQKGFINTEEFVPAWAVKIRVEYANGTAIERIVTETNSDYDLGAVGSVHWSGNLLGRVVCGSPTNSVLLRDLNQQVWKKTAQQPYYANYYGAFNLYQTVPSAGSCPIGGNSIAESFALCSALQSKIAASNSVNNYYTQMIASLGESYSNYYTYAPSQNMIVPVLVWTLNASQVAVEVPKFAKALILSVAMQPIEESNTSRINVSVQNIGTASDSFDVSIQGCTPNPLSLNPARITIGVGETKIAELLVEGFAGTYQCNVLAAPINNNAEGSSSSPLTITINKRICPLEFQCCMNSVAYRDRDCKDEIVPVNRVFTNADGNIVYEACLQLKDFTCGGGSNFACTLASQEDIAGTCSQIIVTPNPTSSVTPTPNVSVTPNPTNTPSPTASPSPTPIVTVINTPSPTPGGSPTPTPTPGGNLFSNPLFIWVSLIVILLLVILYKVFFA